MLDETTCPVCGKDLWRDARDQPQPADVGQVFSVWAVAHYLAHLVQQNQPQSFEEKRDAVEATLKANGFMPNPMMTEPYWQGASEWLDTSDEKVMAELRRRGIIRPL